MCRGRLYSWTHKYVVGSWVCSKTIISACVYIHTSTFIHNTQTHTRNVLLSPSPSRTMYLCLQLYTLLFISYLGESKGIISFVF